MAIQDWPAGLYPQQMEMRLRDSGAQFRSPFSGTLQVANFVGEHWVCDLTLPGRRSDKGEFDPGPALSAFLKWLKGGVNQARLYDFKYFRPRGTLSGTPVLQTTVTRGGQTIVLTTSTSGETVKSGDKFSLGSEYFEVRTDSTGAGTVLTITTVNRVRATITAGAAVTWLRPTINMIMPEMSAGVLYTPGFVQPASIQLEEAL